MQRTQESQAIELLTRQLRTHRGKLTTSDAATLTGLALMEARDALDVMMNRYICRLQVTESGEILYCFGESLRRRGEKSLREKLQHARAWLWEAFKAFFKVWITVMLVVYFVIFVLIVIAAIIAAMAGSRDSKKIRLGWLVDLFADLFTAAARTGTYVWLTDNSGYRHRSFQQTKRKQPEQLEPKKRLVQSVYDFVFGPPRATFDPLANAKEAASYLRASKGVLTPAEAAALAGYDLATAEEQFTDYLTRFKGRPEITDDGVVYGTFEDLLQSADRSMSAPKVELFWDEYEPPFVVTGNASGRNAFIIFANAFNLILSFIFLTSGIESIGLGQAEISGGVLTLLLGWIPFSFSLIFFLVPLSRIPGVKRNESERLQRNVDRRIVRAIFGSAGQCLTREQMIAKVNDGKEVKLDDEHFERRFATLLPLMAGRSDVDDNGRVTYSFPRIEREMKSAARLREELRLDRTSTGSVILEN